ncbi:MAG TPA: proton-conducting transporter membrane subunit [Terriglobales bacterium]|nr:proton-conducting transporter membrane subunit [Terriglobales bacterium]
MSGTYLVPLPVVVPLSVAAILAGLNKFFPRRLADIFAMAATFATGAISLELAFLSRVQPIVYWFGGWTPRAGVALGISFAIDPIGASFAALVSLLVLAALIFSLRYFDSVGTLYHVLMLVFLGAMCGFCLTGDLFNLFVFFELMSASAFALCGYKIEEPESLQGSLNFAITNTVGAFLVLTGIALLYGRTGALNMAQIGRSLGTHADGLVITAFVFIMSGFFIKAAVFPFHFWLADAHAVAPTPVCVLFSGVMVELGLYAVIRVYWAIIDGPFASHRPDLRALLLVVGTITALLGGIMCFGQRHIKRLLAFSTVSHMGLMVIGFALLKPEALAGLALYVVGHGLVKGALFIIAGILLHRLGTVDELELHGRAKDMPISSTIFLIAGLGLAGLPPFGTFLGESQVEHSAGALGFGWVSIVFFIAALLTAGAVFRVWAHVYRGWGDVRGAEKSGSKKIHDKRETRKGQPRPFEMHFAAGVLVALAIAVGLIPGLKHEAKTAALLMQDRAAYQARVLDHAWIPVAQANEPHESEMASLARSTAAAVLAFAFGIFAVSRFWPKKSVVSRPVDVLISILRKPHSGHVGDYVAFLTFGVAAFGIVLAVLIVR